MNPLIGILLAVLSALGFTLMGAMVRYLGGRVPLGELVFVRNFLVLLPLVVYLVWRGELRATLRTANPRGHLMRSLVNIVSMFFNYAGFQRVPLADATAIGFAMPLFSVVLAALFLREVVRAWRWSAVFVGFFGVLIMLAPHLGGVAHSTETLLGAVFLLISAFLIAVVITQVRHLARTETTASILLFYSIFASVVSLATIFTGWVLPEPRDLLALLGVGVFGGFGQLLITESVRHAPASTLAPFAYVGMIYSVVIGYFLFDEWPPALVFVGAAIVIAAGLFVIWREHRLGITRKRRQADVPPLPPPGGPAV